MIRKNDVDELTQVLAICRSLKNENNQFRLFMKIVGYKFRYPDFDMIHFATWFSQLKVESHEIFLDTSMYMYDKNVLKFNVEQS